MAAPVNLQALVIRIEAALPPGLAAQKRMFGGVTFLLHGNMLCCASGKGLMVRVGAAAEAEALAAPYAHRCLGAGRPMAGFIMIEAKGFAKDADLARWLAMAQAYVGTLPPKEKQSEERPAGHGGRKRSAEARRDVTTKTNTREP